VESLVLGACARFDCFVLEYFIRRRPTLPPAGLRERLVRAEAFYSNRRFIERPHVLRPTARSAGGTAAAPAIARR